MTPEEHFTRMRQDEVWNLQASSRPASRRAATIDGGTGSRTQIWATAVVAAAVVAVAAVAIAVAPARGGAPAGAGGAAAASASSAPSAEPSSAAAPSPTDSSTTRPSAAPVAPRVTPSTGSVDSSPAPQAAEPSAAPAPSQAAAMHDGRPAFEFVAADRTDVARGHRVVACLHAEGVRYVDLAAPDADGIRYLEFGGLHNDQQSITLGLQHSDTCIAAAER